MTNRYPTERQLLIRNLRMKGMTYEAIGKQLTPPITKVGVRYSLMSSDRFYDLKLGTFDHFRKFKKKMKLPNANGKKSVQIAQKIAPDSSLNTN